MNSLLCTFEVLLLELGESRRLVRHSHEHRAEVVQRRQESILRRHRLGLCSDRATRDITKIGSILLERGTNPGPGSERYVER